MNKLSLIRVSFLQTANTNVYVSAHPDDWQLFMNPNAYNDVKTNEKVIFIHTTAGDAGSGTEDNNYYLAREEGSLRALRFMSNTFDLGINMDQNVVNINGHQIIKFTYRNIVAYFLRLPDGSRSGDGYKRHNFASLQKLFNGSIASITAIDGSTTYNSLNDLQTTLRILIENESNTDLTFHIADTDNTINSEEHSDHLYSSLPMQNIAKNIGGVTLNLYQDYITRSKPQNVFDNNFMICAGTWAVTTSGLSDNFHCSTWNNLHNEWVGKQYFRTILTTTNSNNNIALGSDIEMELDLAKAEKADIKILSARGIELVAKSFFLKEGRNKVSLPSTTLHSSGMYTIHVKVGNKVKSQKIIVSKLKT